MTRSGKKPRKKKQSGCYTKGELNKFIDSVVHPLCKNNVSLVFVDGFLHSIVERDPPSSVKKFIRYNLPKLIEQFDENTSARR